MMSTSSFFGKEFFKYIAEKLDVNEPSLEQKRLQRYEEGISSSLHPETPKDTVVTIMINILKLLTSQQRFEQPGYQNCQLQEVHLNSVNKKKTMKKSSLLWYRCGSDLDSARLISAQLESFLLNLMKVHFSDVCCFLKHQCSKQCLPK